MAMKSMARSRKSRKMPMKKKMSKRSAKISCKDEMMVGSGYLMNENVNQHVVIEQYKKSGAAKEFKERQYYFDNHSSSINHFWLRLA